MSDTLTVEPELEIIETEGDVERGSSRYPTQPGDHDKFAHFVKANSILESALEGGAVQALCGHVWVPTRDPKQFPVCPECKEIYDRLDPDDGQGPPQE